MSKEEPYVYVDKYKQTLQLGDLIITARSASTLEVTICTIVGLGVISLDEDIHYLNEAKIGSKAIQVCGLKGGVVWRRPDDVVKISDKLEDIVTANIL